MHHNIHHADPNGALFIHTYGFGVQNSYALAGGQELQPISVSLLFNTSNIDIIVFAGTVIQCTVPDQCVESGNTITVTCTRSLDLSEQTRIRVQTKDGAATGNLCTLSLFQTQLAKLSLAPDDYTTLALPVNRPLYRQNNILNFRGGNRQDR